MLPAYGGSVKSKLIDSEGSGLFDAKTPRIDRGTDPWGDENKAFVQLLLVTVNTPIRNRYMQCRVYVKPLTTHDDISTYAGFCDARICITGFSRNPDPNQQRCECHPDQYLFHFTSPFNLGDKSVTPIGCLWTKGAG